MSLPQKAKSLLDLLYRRRRSGNTSILIEATKNSKGILLTATADQASMLRESHQIKSSTITPYLLESQEPILVDNFLIQDVLEECNKTITDINKEKNELTETVNNLKEYDNSRFVTWSQLKRYLPFWTRDLDDALLVAEEIAILEKAKKIRKPTIESYVLAKPVRTSKQNLDPSTIVRCPSTNCILLFDSIGLAEEYRLSYNLDDYYVWNNFIETGSAVD